MSSTTVVKWVFGGVFGLGLAGAMMYTEQSSVTERFSSDYQCPADQVKLSGIGRRGYRLAEGCGNRCVYGVVLSSVSKTKDCD